MIGSRLGASVVLAEMNVPPARRWAAAGAAATAAAVADSARKLRRLIMAFSCSCQGHDRVEPRLVADDPRDVPSPRQVLGQHHVAGTDAGFRAVTDLDLGDT